MEPDSSSGGGWTSSSEDGASGSGSAYDSDDWELDIVDQPLIAAPASRPAE